MILGGIYESVIMNGWSIEKMAGHCGARLNGASLSTASVCDLEKMWSAVFNMAL